MAESKHQRIVETLKREILSGKYSATRAFPSERALASRFKASRPTVRIALQTLRAQGLVTQRQGSGTAVTSAGARRKIGLVIPDVSQSEYFVRIVRELIRVAEREQYSLVFTEVTGKTPDERIASAERLVADLIRQDVSGVIFQPIEYCADGNALSARLLAQLDAAHIPVVLCDNDFTDGESRHDVVGTSDIRAGRAMHDHLVACGARRICFFMRPYAPQTHKDRYRGMAMAGLASGADVLRRQALLVAEPDDAAAIRRSLRAGRVDAFMCGDDETAARLMRTLGKIGCAVPESVMVSGFNDLHVASLLSPSLTTMRISCEQIADAACLRLIARLRNPGLPPTEQLFPAQLVVRESTSKHHRTGGKRT